ncbi:hypothetical protein FALCPG4_010997 [Fusarium falciforme]
MSANIQTEDVGSERSFYLRADFSTFNNNLQRLHLLFSPPFLIGNPQLNLTTHILTNAPEYPFGHFEEIVCLNMKVLYGNGSSSSKRTQFRMEPRLFTQLLTDLQVEVSANFTLSFTRHSKAVTRRPH